VPDRVKPSCVIFDIGTLMLSPECQSAQMSKITNDGLTQSGTGLSKKKTSIYRAHTRTQLGKPNYA